MRGADVVVPPATERSRVLFFPVRIVVASLAIVVSLQSFIGAIGFPALPPDGFFFFAAFPGRPYRMSFTTGVPGTTMASPGIPSLACFLSTMIGFDCAIVSATPLCYGVFVSRFHGWERKSLACIAFCSDSLILTDLRVFVHRWQGQVWPRMQSCCCYQSLQIVVIVDMVAL